MKPLRLIELFAGYGSQAMALKRLGVPFEHWKVVEFDKYAIRSYNAVHGTNFPTIDIRDVKGEDLEISNTDEFDYLLFYSFPCTDLSLASGNAEGMGRESNTRSGLLWEVERLLKECETLPQILIMENVPQVHGKKHIADFNEWITFLDSLGYKSRWQDMNATEHGIPQNRNRTFMVSVLDNRPFHFPMPRELNIKLKDLLEEDVDEKYFFEVEMMNSFKVNDLEQLVIPTNNEKGFDVAEHGDSIDLSFPNSKTRRGRIGHGVSQTIPSTKIPNVVISERRKQHRKYGWINTIHTENVTAERIEPRCLNLKGGRQGKDGIQPSLQDRVYDVNEVAVALTASNYKPKYTDGIRIRKLTAKECLLLMGVSSEDANRMLAINSDTQCYLQAGNSIVVDVLVDLFRVLFFPEQTEDEPYQMDIFDFLGGSND